MTASNQGEGCPTTDRPITPPDARTTDDAPEPSGRKGDGSDPDAPPDLPGYEVLGVLGRGGMGVVYKARQRGLNRVVAVKMIRTGSAPGPRGRRAPGATVLLDGIRRGGQSG